MVRNFYPERTDPRGLQKNQRAIEAILSAAVASSIPSVKDFGALGNGAADDTAAIQRAVNATPSGGALLFPPGHYIITAPLKDNGQDYVTILGCGHASKIEGTTNFQTLWTISGRTGWTFCNLWLYGPGNGRRVTVDQEGCGLQIITSSHCEVAGCRIENCGLHDGTDPGIAGVYLRESCTYCRVHDNLFIDCNSAVVEDAYVQTSTPYGNEAVDNISIRCRAHFAADSRGFAGAIGSSMKICGNLIDGHATDSSTERYGIRVMDTRGATVNNNTIRNVNTGIELYADCLRAVVSGNTIVTPTRTTAYGGHGIHVRNNPGATTRRPVGCVLADNIVDTPELIGIYLEDGLGVTAANNRVRNAGTVGIQVSLSRAILSENAVEAAGSHAIYVTGAGCDAVLIHGGLLVGDSADTGLTDDAIRVDATVGGRTHISGVMIFNLAATAGFKYGINRPSGAAGVDWGACRFVNMGTADVNPTSLRAAKVDNPTFSGNMRLDNWTSVSSATAGSASALPATPGGYYVQTLNGTNVRVPWYPA